MWGSTFCSCQRTESAKFSSKAQITTYSSCDANLNGVVDITDVTNNVNKILGKAAASQEVVTAKDLNSLLNSINEKLDGLTVRMDAIEKKLGIAPVVPLNENGHVCVDLGLSVKWATMNIGATGVVDKTLISTNPGRYNYQGKLFEWGAVKSKEVGEFDPGNYSLTGLNTLDSSHDVVTVSWGGKWRMPTREEFLELKNKCYWEAVSTYNGVDVLGFVIYKAKDNTDKGKVLSGLYQTVARPTAMYDVKEDIHIFLPATGMVDVYNGGYINETIGYYWTSNAENPSQHSSYDFSCDVFGKSTDVSFTMSFYGMGVRGVCP